MYISSEALPLVKLLHRHRLGIYLYVYIMTHQSCRLQPGEARQLVQVRYVHAPEGPVEGDKGAEAEEEEGDSFELCYRQWSRRSNITESEDVSYVSSPFLPEVGFIHFVTWNEGWLGSERGSGGSVETIRCMPSQSTILIY